MEISADIIRGHIDTIILKLLLNEDMYGYRISKTIHSATDGAYELKEATMYSSLKRLESDGCINWYWGDETQGGRRKYYKITEKGKTTYVENKKNWEYAKHLIDNLIIKEFEIMNEKLDQYLNGVFAPYDGVKSVAELKADLLYDLQERFRELIADGKDDETAFQITIDSIGDIEQTVREVANVSRSLERQLLINFSASNLPESDFAGVTVHNGKFEASALRGSDFSGADLTGSSFKASDMREANFNGANLTDCNFFALDLAGASFNGSILVRSNFSTSMLEGAKFIDAKFIDVKLTVSDLRKTIFENCIFEGVDFKTSDLTGLCLDEQTFIGVKFDKAALKEATFRGSTLKNVSFTPPWSLTNKYYRAIKSICFDGAMIDKLTYASLKGMGADLSKVTII